MRAPAGRRDRVRRRRLPLRNRWCRRRRRSRPCMRRDIGRPPGAPDPARIAAGPRPVHRSRRCPRPRRHPRASSRPPRRPAAEARRGRRTNTPCRQGRAPERANRGGSTPTRAPAARCNPRTDAATAKGRASPARGRAAAPHLRNRLRTRHRDASPSIGAQEPANTIRTSRVWSGVPPAGSRTRPHRGRAAVHTCRACAPHSRRRRASGSSSVQPVFDAEPWDAPKLADVVGREPPPERERMGGNERVERADRRAPSLEARSERAVAFRRGCIERHHRAA